MANILKVRNVSDYSSFVGHKDTHPLVSVIDYSAVSPIRSSLNDYSVYGLFFHDAAELDLRYGCGRYDYRKGAVICVAPGQIGGKEDDGQRIAINGWALLFHPDLIRGTHLERSIRDYTFFDYRVNEALHTTDEERAVLESLMRQMQDELRKQRDAVQDAILVGYIELTLNYCQRFYNRQFVTRKLENSDILVRFNALLQDYFEDKLQLTLGIPSVQYCADRLSMSPNYFGDLVKKTTGETAGNYIRRRVIAMAKDSLAGGKGIAQTAYDLGFEYPQHLSRMFRKTVGITPTQYLASLSSLNKKHSC